MTKVYFIQYHRPDGRPERVIIDRSEEIAAKAQRIWDLGLRLEIEVLTNGMISMTISDNAGDYAGEICKNGPEVEEAVDRLIKGFEI